MSYLLDTNVVSELRKERKCDPRVMAWIQASLDVGHYLSVITLGEIRTGIERLKGKDPVQADNIEKWLQQLKTSYAGSILDVTEEISECWGRLNNPDRVPTADGLIAATALVYGLTIATRNATDFARTGVSMINPFD